jgi:hypothetical protein
MKMRAAQIPLTTHTHARTLTSPDQPTTGARGAKDAKITYINKSTAKTPTIITNTVCFRTLTCRSSSSAPPPRCNLQLPRAARSPRRRDLPCPPNCSSRWSSWTAALATCRTTRARTADRSRTAFPAASRTHLRTPTPCRRPAPAPPSARWSTTAVAATGRRGASPVPVSCARPLLARSRRPRRPTATPATTTPTPGALPAATRAVGTQPSRPTPTSTPTGECPWLIDSLSFSLSLSS